MSEGYSELANELKGMAGQLCSSLVPSWVDVGMLVASILMVVATVIIVVYNGKTVQASLRQIAESVPSV